MSKLLSLEGVSLAFGLQPLLDQVTLTIDKGERVCLVGRNGAGKSSLLKIIAGEIQPDSGSIWRHPSLKLTRLPQEPPKNVECSVYEYVSQGLREAGALLTRYHTLINTLETSASHEDIEELGKLQLAIDAHGAWDFDQIIETTLSRLELDPDAKIGDLSGGWQRRAALAKALVLSPDLLLLDEPTNHLDIEAISWLEKTLLNLNIGIIFITHDRALLKKLATRIIELDCGAITSWPGDYENFLIRKEERLAIEERENAEFDKRLAEEEVWIRQGIKARRTRNEGRVRALTALRNERSERREKQGHIKLHRHDLEKSGKLVIEAKNISHGYHDKKLINDFSTRIMRGDRIGLIGPNGIGKSTFLNILLGNLQPQQGTVNHGTKLEISYYDQLREQLDPEKSIIDNVAEGASAIEINGQERHIISYLKDFLFTPERARTKVKSLSGGECNRLLLARLLIKPANLLVMDEPTNDLDIESLELLEELLCNYQGTLLLVSHDRAFLDNVVTSTMVFEGNGVIQEFVGGYDDWKRQSKLAPKEKSTPKKVNKKSSVPSVSSKLTFNEKKELQTLLRTIESLEASIAELQVLLSAESFYDNGKDTIESTLLKVSELEKKLSAAYQRWEALEERK